MQWDLKEGFKVMNSVEETGRKQLLLLDSLRNERKQKIDDWQQNQHFQEEHWERMPKVVMEADSIVVAKWELDEYLVIENLNG